MLITGIRTGLLTVPLHKPFKTALRTVERLSTLIVSVETDTGLNGWGEAPPTGAITGDSLGSIRGAISEYIFPRLKGLAVENLEVIQKALSSSCVKNTSAKAAVDMAVYDLFGKMHNIPLYRLFGGFRNTVETDLTISVNSPEEMAADAKDAVARGFRILKIKVGLNPALDIERMAAVRAAAGKSAILRLDANQGWSAKEAVRIMKILEAADPDIELVEQPVPAHDFAGLKHVRDSVATPVLADESVFSPADASELIALRAADMINIKLMKTGGLANALKICAIAEIHSVPCFMGCMMESKLSVTAAAHLACGRSVITACDLDSPILCSEDPVRGGITIDGSRLSVLDKPGLGIDGVDGVVWD
ncbi:MAG: dipeptide epimerase [Candidatus Wallbacteria bacterium]|nr:dipeptide epimerase [Candidatus Wallbacteria bacterium]